MTVTAPSSSIELTRGSIFARIGRREIFVTREYGQPRMVFDMHRSEDALELWGFGFYFVTNARPELLHTAG